MMDRVSNVHNRQPDWLDHSRVLSWDLRANRPLRNKERLGAAALGSTPSGHETTSKSNEPVDDIRGLPPCGATVDVAPTRQWMADLLRLSCVRLPRTHLESEPTGRAGREPCAVALSGRAGRAVAHERCHSSGTKPTAPSRYPSLPSRRALRRPTATRMPKMMASGRGGQPGM